MSYGKTKLQAIDWLTENARMLIVSFFIASIIWIFAKSGETEEARIQVPVIVTLGDRRPDDRMGLNVNPSRIQVDLRYPKRLDRYISSENFRFEIDARDMVNDLGLDWKTMSQPLTEKNWVANVPQARRIEVVKIGTQSNTVEVALRWNAQPAVVVANVVGTERLPEGLQLVTPVTVTPREVWVVGDMQALGTIPRDTLTSKIQLMTEPVDASANMQGGSKSVAIRLPPGVEIIQPRGRFAEVDLNLQEVQTIREITNVRFDFEALNPDAVEMTYKEKSGTVTVFGPPSLLKQLSPDSFEVSLVRPSEELPGTTKDVPVEAHFGENVPADIKSRVVIRTVSPKSIKVSYMARAPQP